MHGPELFTRRRSLSPGGSQLAGGQPARRHPRQGGGLPAPGQGRLHPLAQDPGGQGLVGAALAGGNRWHRLEHHPALHLRRRVRLGRRTRPAALRPGDVCVGAAQVRHARAEGALPAAHPRG